MSEKTSITIEEARALISDTVLWPRVRDFLWDFASQIHTSWIAGLGQGPSGEGREDESGSSRVSRLMSSSRVKRLVLMELGVDPCFHSFPKDDWSRLLLLDGATIESIVNGLVRWRWPTICAWLRTARRSESSRRRSRASIQKCLDIRRISRGLIYKAEMQRRGARAIRRPMVGSRLLQMSFHMGWRSSTPFLLRFPNVLYLASNSNFPRDSVPLRLCDLSPRRAAKWSPGFSN